MNGKNVLLISMLLVSPVAFAAQPADATTSTQNLPAAATVNPPVAPDAPKPPVVEPKAAETIPAIPVADLKGNFITVAYSFAKGNKLAASFLLATGAVTALAVRAFFASPISEQNDDEDIN